MKKFSFLLCAAALALATTLTSCSNEDNSYGPDDVVVRNGYKLTEIIEDALEKYSSDEISVSLPDTVTLFLDDNFIQIPEGKTVTLVGNENAPARLNMSKSFNIDGNLTIKNMDITAKMDAYNPFVASATENNTIVFEGVTVKGLNGDLIPWFALEGTTFSFIGCDIDKTNIYVNNAIVVKDSKIKLTNSIYIENPSLLTVENTEFDAEAANPALFVLGSNPGEKNEKGIYVIEEPIVLKGIKATNINGGIISAYPWDSNVKYVIKDMQIEDCVFGLNPQWGFNAVVDFSNGGILNFSIKNSTVYNISEANNCTYFTKYNNSIVPDNAGLPADDVVAGVWSWTYTNNTFYKVATGQWHNGGRIAQKCSLMDVDIENNLWYDCATNGSGILRRLFGGNKNTGNFHTAVVNGNTWVQHDATGKATFEDASSYNRTDGVDVKYDPQFANPLEGDFTSGAENGDPRWK